MTTICANETCGHPTDGIPFSWAPGHLGGSLCACCLRAIWEKTLADVTKALADHPALTWEECLEGKGLVAR
jgi:hypothetical protein